MFAHSAVGIFGGWSHSFWSFLFVLTAMVGVTEVGTQARFALRITVTSRASNMRRNNHIYFILDDGAKNSYQMYHFELILI